MMGVPNGVAPLIVRAAVIDIGDAAAALQLEALVDAVGAAGSAGSSDADPRRDVGTSRSPTPGRKNVVNTVSNAMNASVDANHSVICGKMCTASGDVITVTSVARPSMFGRSLCRTR